MLFQSYKWLRGDSTRQYLILQGPFHSFNLDGIPLFTKNIFLKQMEYFELACLLGGSVLSWSVVLAVLLCIYHSLMAVFCIYCNVYT
jgi:hypothetical protein